MDRDAFLEARCARDEAWACANRGYRAEQADAPELARHYYALGCELGSAWSCDEWGVAVEGDAIGTWSPRSTPSAEALFRFACDAGQATACYHLALRLRIETPAEALPLFDAGCRDGVSDACGYALELSDAERERRGLPFDIGHAIEMTLLACDDPRGCRSAAWRMRGSLSDRLRDALDASDVDGEARAFGLALDCAMADALEGGCFDAALALLTAPEPSPALLRMQPVVASFCPPGSGGPAMACALVGVFELRDGHFGRAAVALGRACESTARACVILGRAHADGRLGRAQPALALEAYRTGCLDGFDAVSCAAGVALLDDQALPIGATLREELREAFANAAATAESYDEGCCYYGDEDAEGGYDESEEEAP